MGVRAACSVVVGAAWAGRDADTAAQQHLCAVLAPRQVRFMSRMDHPNIVEMNTAFMSADGTKLYVGAGFVCGGSRGSGGCGCGNDDDPAVVTSTLSLCQNREQVHSNDVL